jgi:hypothetical protein
MIFHKLTIVPPLKMRGLFIFTAKGLGIGEGGDFGAPQCQLVSYFDRITSLDFTNNSHFWLGALSRSLFFSTFQIVYLRSTFLSTRNSFTEVHLMYEYLSLSYF